MILFHIINSIQPLKIMFGAYAKIMGECPQYSVNLLKEARYKRVEKIHIFH